MALLRVGVCVCVCVCVLVFFIGGHIPSSPVVKFVFRMRTVDELPKHVVATGPFRAGSDLSHHRKPALFA